LRRDRQATISDLEAREAVARRIVRSSFERPGRVLASWLLLAAVASLGVFRLEVETSTDSVLDRSGEGWRFYQEVQERFGGDEIVVLVIEGREPFDPGMLAEVVRITNALEELPGVRRVDSLATVPLVRATADADISLDAALAGGVPTEAEARDRLARRLRADRIAPRNLVSDSGRAVAVNVLLEQGPEARYGAILGAVDRVRGARSAWVSGVPVFRNVADARTAAELTTFVPLTLALVGTLLFALFGSMRAVLIPLVASGVGIWVMLGAMGAVGVPLTISTVILPSVLLALGCAYSMHNLAVAAGCRTPQELGDALESVALPITLSGLTTAVGFVAVSLVRIEVIRDVGAFGALGVLVVVAATLTAAPAALRLWPLPVRRNGFRDWLGGPAARGLIGFVGARRGALLLGWSVALAVVAVGIARVRVESDVVLWFPRHDPIRVAYEAIRERFSGISPMNVVIEAPEGASVTAPEVVAALGGLTTYLETLPEVGRALSLADPLRQLHRGFMGGVDERVPKRADLIEQYLLILAAPCGGQRRALVDRERPPGLSGAYHRHHVRVRARRGRDRVRTASGPRLRDPRDRPHPAGDLPLPKASGRGARPERATRCDGLRHDGAYPHTARRRHRAGRQSRARDRGGRHDPCGDRLLPGAHGPGERRARAARRLRTRAASGRLHDARGLPRLRGSGFLGLHLYPKSRHRHDRHHAAVPGRQRAAAAGAAPGRRAAGRAGRARGPPRRIAEPRLKPKS
jgi:hypothetical protein